MSENVAGVIVPDEISGEVNRMVAWAKSLIIATPEDRSKAIEAIKLVKTHCKAVVDSFDASAKAAHAAWKSVTEHRAKFTAPLEESEKLVKAAIIRYDNEQEAIRQKEQARLQAEADEKARIERERAMRDAEKLKTPELKQQRLEEAAQIVAPVVQVAPVAVKQAGESTRKTWRAKVIDANKVPREFLIVNEKALDAFAKATKGSMKIEGVEFYEESSLAIKI